MKKLICNGAMCSCSAGTNSLPVIGYSNISSYEKEILLEDSKPVGTFGICQILSQGGEPVPCTMALATRWNGVSKNMKINNKSPLLETSTLKCSVGGNIALHNGTSGILIGG